MPPVLWVADVFVGVDVLGVFDFEAVNVELDAIAAEDDVLGLADVDAGVGGAFGDGILDQQVLATHGINAVRAVGGVGAAGPFDAHAADGDVGAVLDGERVAGGVFDGDIFDGEIVGFDEHALRAGFLSGERKDGLVHALAADGDAVDGER